MAATECKHCGSTDMATRRAVCRECEREETRRRQTAARVRKHELRHEPVCYFCDPAWASKPIRTNPDV